MEAAMIDIKDREPEEGQDVYYYFEPIGTHPGKYYGNGNFAGPKGFLCGQEVTHWRPRDDSSTMH